MADIVVDRDMKKIDIFNPSMNGRGLGFQDLDILEFRHPGEDDEEEGSDDQEEWGEGDEVSSQGS